jgi:isoleucyl-tRNA synthetase
MDYFMAAEKKTFLIHDGPPFATGKPHYGHLLTMTVKDIVTRYMRSQGYVVPRRPGWDCHGLPIEFQIEERLGLKSKRDVESYGIKPYCDACRDIVLQCVDDWHHVYKQMDCLFDNLDEPYMTMSSEYIQGVWSVLARLHERGLIYQGYKVMPFSVGCGTPLSNFEVSMDYREITDLSAKVLFRLSGTERFLCAWTTTPWSLVANQALCVNPEATYVLQAQPWPESERLIWVVRDQADPKLPIVDTCIGKELAGLEYEPLFSFQTQQQNVFTVLADPYVSVDSGTGIVHLAPMFGEDDYRVCLDAGIITERTRFTVPYDDNGYMLPEIAGHFQFPTGMDDDKYRELHFFTKVNKFVLKALQYPYITKDIRHNYPFCWRSGKPLMYRAVSSWFVDVNAIREDMLEVIGQIHWVPDYIGAKRLANWVRDGKQNWCFSRNRYWGAPIPVWTDPTGTEKVVIGDIKQLLDLHATLDGKPLTEEMALKLDLHRPTLDKIRIPSQRGNGELERVPEVFDCWFESGSMPFASGCPDPCADFIAEGLDQTRGWFYTLTVLSTALLKRPAFKNVIVTGIILAEDGQKMSKSKNNYRPVTEVLDKYGADAIRLYLSQTRATCAEEVRVDYSQIQQMSQTIIIPLQNVMALLTETMHLKSVSEPCSTQHVLMVSDWLLNRAHGYLEQFHRDMKQFRLWNIVGYVQSLVDDLSRKYVNLNKGILTDQESGSISDAAHIHRVCRCVLQIVAEMLYPFTPHLHRQLTQQNYTVKDTKADEADKGAEGLFHCLDALKSYRERIRGTNGSGLGPGCGFKYPIQSIKIPEGVLPKCLTPYIMSSCNVLHVEWCKWPETIITTNTKIVLDLKKVGPKLGRRLQDIKKICESPTESYSDLYEHITYTYPNLMLGEDYQITEIHTLRPEPEIGPGWVLVQDRDQNPERCWPMQVSLSCSPEQDDIYRERELRAAVSRLRKSYGLKRQDPVKVYMEYVGDASGAEPPFILPDWVIEGNGSFSELAERLHEVCLGYVVCLG